MKGRVVKVETDKFTVIADEQSIICPARKKVKLKSIVKVGDIVEIERDGDNFALSRICERKNVLIRPSVANVDAVVMVLSPIPVPDYTLADKMLINCAEKGIKCIICANKTDISQSFYDEIAFQYSSDAVVVSACAERGEVKNLRDAIKGKFVCMAGQSAVGKSSLINALVGKKVAASGTLSAIERGKNTTTKATLYALGNDTYVADTPGFGLLDVFDVAADELDLYYSEYVAHSGKCRYHRCTHISEPDCEVKRLVETGKLSKARYDRYVKLFAELKNAKKTY